MGWQSVATSAVFATDYALFSLEGDDSLAFAHAQLASNVLQLTDGDWQWSCGLSAQGRVFAIMLIVRESATRLWCLVPGGHALTLIARLQRFVLRRQVRLVPHPDRVVLGITWANTQGPSPMAKPLTDVLTIATQVAEQQRWLVVVPRNHPLAQQQANAQHRQWAQWDLQMGVAYLPPEHLERWTVQQLGLERLHAFSLNKGCFPGQEIVARTHYLGTAKRRPVRLTAHQPFAGPAEVTTTSDQTMGELIMTEGMEGFAVLRVQALDQPLFVAGQPVIAQPWVPANLPPPSTSSTAPDYTVE